jgi:rubredoxin
MKTIQCKKCGKDFNVSPSKKTQYCSKVCYESMPKTWLIGHKHGFKKGEPAWNKGVAWSQEVKDKVSLSKKGKPSSFLGQKHTPESLKKMSENRKGKLHSEETKKKMSETRRGKNNPSFGKTYRSGENHYNWQGGISNENRRIRHSKEFTHWRNEVFARDNWLCQECKTKKKEIHPHHIKAFAIYPELRFEVSNGITLCKECHEKTDNYGHKINRWNLKNVQN